MSEKAKKQTDEIVEFITATREAREKNYYSDSDTFDMKAWIAMNAQRLNTTERRLRRHLRRNNMID